MTRFDGAVSAPLSHTCGKRRCGETRARWARVRSCSVHAIAASTCSSPGAQKRAQSQQQHAALIYSGAVNDPAASCRRDPRLCWDAGMLTTGTRVYKSTWFTKLEGLYGLLQYDTEALREMRYRNTVQYTVFDILTFFYTPTVRYSTSALASVNA